MKRQYLWTGEQRMLPNVGAPAPGDTIELDEVIGQSYVEQGLCEEAPQAVDQQAAVAAEEE